MTDTPITKNEFENYREKNGERLGSLEIKQAVLENKLDTLIDGMGQMRLSVNTVLENTKDLSKGFALLEQKISFVKFAPIIIIALGAIVYGAIEYIKGGGGK
jgi:hypothetical protein